MSRLRNTARSLASGYAAIAVNVVYTLGSVPLALHYLSKAEFGLWATVTQVASYLLLIDAGMSGSVSRFLMDYKDDPTDPRYGAVIQTGLLVFLVQGTCIALGGTALSFGLPGLMHVPTEFAGIFQLLVAAQCILLGAFFADRILTGLLQAHHRFDLMNYTQIAQLIISFAVQWIAFHLGWGLYSLLVATFAAFFTRFVNNLISVLRLKLLPSKGCWGRPSRGIFDEIFAFARDMFLTLVGYQLLNASQLVVISRTLGLSAAAIWSVANKVFPVAFQGVSRILDFSGSAIAELHIRGERDKLRRRYADVLLLTASAAVFAGAAIAVCNSSFLIVWTKGEIAWPRRNDILLGLLLTLICVTRCPIALSGYLKNMGPIRWIYFFEGVSFFTASWLVAPRFGMTGILSAAVAADIVWSGGYGLWRTAFLFGVSTSTVVKWLRLPGNYLLLMIPIVAVLWWAASRLPPLLGLMTNTTAIITAGLALFWFAGLSPALRQELSGVARRMLT